MHTFSKISLKCFFEEIFCGLSGLKYKINRTTNTKRVNPFDVKCNQSMQQQFN